MSRFLSIQGKVLVVLSVWALLGAAPPFPTEPSAIVRRLDFGACEPVRFRATIMEADLEKQTLIVAEKEVRRMDLATAERRIVTGFVNADGEPVPFASFKAGRMVSVSGYAHPDGFVAATQVALLSAAGGRKATGVRKK